MVGKTTETVNPSQGGQQVKQGIDQADGGQLLEQGQSLMESPMIQREFGGVSSFSPQSVVVSDPSPTNRIEGLYQHASQAIQALHSADSYNEAQAQLETALQTINEIVDVKYRQPKRDAGQHLILIGPELMRDAQISCMLGDLQQIATQRHLSRDLDRLATQLRLPLGGLPGGDPISEKVGQVIALLKADPLDERTIITSLREASEMALRASDARGLENVGNAYIALGQQTRNADAVDAGIVLLKQASLVQNKFDVNTPLPAISQDEKRFYQTQYRPLLELEDTQALGDIRPGTKPDVIQTMYQRLIATESISSQEGQTVVYNTGSPSQLTAPELAAVANFSSTVQDLVLQVHAEILSGDFSKFRGNYFDTWQRGRTEQGAGHDFEAANLGYVIEERVYQLLEAKSHKIDATNFELNGVRWSRQSSEQMSKATRPDITLSLGRGREAYLDITSDGTGIGHVLNKGASRGEWLRKGSFVAEITYPKFELTSGIPDPATSKAPVSYEQRQKNQILILQMIRNQQGREALKTEIGGQLRDLINGRFKGHMAHLANSLFLTKNAGTRRQREDTEPLQKITGQAVKSMFVKDIGSSKLERLHGQEGDRIALQEIANGIGYARDYMQAVEAGTEKLENGDVFIPTATLDHISDLIERYQTLEEEYDDFNRTLQGIEIDDDVDYEDDVDEVSSQSSSDGGDSLVQKRPRLDLHDDAAQGLGSDKAESVRSVDDLGGDEEGGYILVEAANNQFQLFGGRSGCSPMSMLGIAHLFATNGVPTVDGLQRTLTDGVAAFRIMHQNAVLVAREARVDVNTRYFNPVEIPDRTVADNGLVRGATVTQANRGSAITDRLTALMAAAPGDIGLSVVLNAYTVSVTKVNNQYIVYDSHGFYPVSSKAFSASFGTAVEAMEMIQRMINGRLRDGDDASITSFTRRV
ncbi:hypothetical protein COW36_00230 [bacterium (Candidatus Blackallbacteria) CG17_big_fil_post_rev_8_21_14_2_50_48_46]|uniref:Uncharacterized protein n=1 Tax=bacterium (Candidatus Blackallbacteria) CG17_big_fil_post_rev_8_21_14_2_50_48_46 TaxID=2014261 RepID=A0A2M7GBN7_9BACT|nr:MAG: hypothetical protein COW64_25735 [bacterium (Candidatus Blackallbacteria) CG18_big_fil_WC_8_21_14_2_50_49_26]PIW19608.1 MAG: hypothetical protein COW36_00230 [bacterium (Candidatus Blackallbacteria) CG17_big_fil_post_rev_8_21_14_2_50_48_46]